MSYPNKKTYTYLFLSYFIIYSFGIMTVLDKRSGAGFILFAIVFTYIFSKTLRDTIKGKPYVVEIPIKERVRDTSLEGEFEIWD